MGTVCGRGQRLLVVAVTWLLTLLPLADTCLAARTPSFPKPPGAVQRRHQVQVNGEGVSGFALFVTLAGVMAVTHWTGRWLGSRFSAGRPKLMATIAGAVLGLIGALCLHRAMDWPPLPSWATCVPDFLCLAFGITYGRLASTTNLPRTCPGPE